MDHIIVNEKGKVRESGVIDSGLSDHLVTYCSRGFSGNATGGSLIKKVRSFKNYSASKLNDQLARIDWSGILLSTDVEHCLGEFSRLFKGAINAVAPFREIRIRHRESPWMNSHIMAGIRQRDKLLSQFKRNKGDQSLYKEFCKVRNSVQRDIKRAKADYFMNKVEQSTLRQFVTIKYLLP